MTFKEHIKIPPLWWGFLNSPSIGFNKSPHCVTKKYRELEAGRVSAPGGRAQSERKRDFHAGKREASFCDTVRKKVL